MSTSFHGNHISTYIPCPLGELHTTHYVRIPSNFINTSDDNNSEDKDAPPPPPILTVHPPTEEDDENDGNPVTQLTLGACPFENVQGHDKPHQFQADGVFFTSGGHRGQTPSLFSAIKGDQLVECVLRGEAVAVALLGGPKTGGYNSLFGQRLGKQDTTRPRPPSFIETFVEKLLTATDKLPLGCSLHIAGCVLFNNPHTPSVMNDISVPFAAMNPATAAWLCTSRTLTARIDAVESGILEVDNNNNNNNCGRDRHSAQWRQKLRALEQRHIDRLIGRAEDDKKLCTVSAGHVLGSATGALCRICCTQDIIDMLSSAECVASSYVRDYPATLATRDVPSTIVSLRVTVLNPAANSCACATVLLARVPGKNFPSGSLASITTGGVLDTLASCAEQIINARRSGERGAAHPPFRSHAVAAMLKPMIEGRDCHRTIVSCLPVSPNEKPEATYFPIFNVLRIASLLREYRFQLNSQWHNATTQAEHLCSKKQGDHDVAADEQCGAVVAGAKRWFVQEARAQVLRRATFPLAKRKPK